MGHMKRTSQEMGMATWRKQKTTIDEWNKYEQNVKEKRET